MAYIFHEDKLPKLVSAVPGRERTFFVNKELTKIDDMLAGIMRYKQGASSPLSSARELRALLLHHGRQGTVETPEGIAQSGSGRHGIYSGGGEASPARHRIATLLFRVSGAEPLCDDDPRRHSGGPDMEPRGRRRLGSNIARDMTSKTTFIDTNKLPRVKTPQGEATEILNSALVGAKNVLGTLRWLKSGEHFEAEPKESIS